MITLHIDTKDLARVQKALVETPKKVQRAAYFATRRTVTRVKTRLSVNTRKQYTVNAGEVKKALEVQKPSYSNIKAAVIATGKQLPLRSFRIRNNTTRPVRVQVKRGAGGKSVKGLFIRRFPKGYEGPMHRRQRGRYPLATPGGPSVPQMVEKPEVFDEVEKDAENFLAKRFSHELDYFLK